jgi:hypothetical protein
MQPLQVFDCQQHSLDWFRARAGIPTASEFQTLLAVGKGGGESKERRTYMYKLAGERLTGEPMHNFSSEHMDRGRDMEDEARKAYSLAADLEPEQIGFLRRGDAGASPDSLIGETGLLEIKTRSPHLQIETLLADVIPKQNLAQAQGQLWIADREWVDVVSYWPGLPLFCKRAYRDEAMIARLKVEVDDFNAQLVEVIERVKNYKRTA